MIHRTENILGNIFLWASYEQLFNSRITLKRAASSYVADVNFSTLYKLLSSPWETMKRWIRTGKMNFTANSVILKEEAIHVSSS